MLTTRVQLTVFKR